MFSSPADDIFITSSELETSKSWKNTLVVKAWLVLEFVSFLKKLYSLVFPTIDQFRILWDF